ncbi:MAG: tetratricopeptide repeat protein [Spirochaetales bacterium]|nr:tetratricopeptide repeat protein [Spirochaetales bacterium]
MKAKDNTPELTTTEKVARSVEKFFSKNAKLIAIIAAVVVVLVIVIGIVVTINGKNSEKQFTAIAKLDSQYSALINMDDTTDEYKNAVSTFLSDADALIASSKDYPGLKAKYLKGLYSFDNKDYSAAASIFEEVSNSANNSYLGSLALINAAASYENAGNQAKALELYNKVWDSYGKNEAVSQKALFNVARIYEEKGDSELAKATYQQLVDEFGTTGEYAKLAASRIVVL